MHCAQTVAGQLVPVVLPHVFIVAHVAVDCAVTLAGVKSKIDVSMTSTEMTTFFILVPVFLTEGFRRPRVCRSFSNEINIFSIKYYCSIKTISSFRVL